MFVDDERLMRVTQTAFDAVRGDRRWEVAIARAAVQFESNPYLHWDGLTLLILSPSNAIYSAGRGCQCKAYRRGTACWHRAAARLMLRYDQSLGRQ